MPQTHREEQRQSEGREEGEKPVVSLIVWADVLMALKDKRYMGYFCTFQ